MEKVDLTEGQISLQTCGPKGGGQNTLCEDAETPNTNHAHAAVAWVKCFGSSAIAFSSPQREEQRLLRRR